MHKVNTKNLDFRTDLVMDNNINSNQIFDHNNVSLYTSTINKHNYSTITFKDITDNNQKELVSNILINELKRYIKKDNILVIGLGNRLSTPDALGPKVLDNILVTRHLYETNTLDKNYKIVSIFEPSVYGRSGIDSTILIKDIVDLIKPDTCIIIDSLQTSSTDRLIKTIQITSKGINPGSGVYNDRGELSSNTLKCNVVAIGIPTVINLDTIISNTLKDYDIDNVNIEDNLIVTPKEIDYVIETISLIISESINKAIHNIYRHNNIY